MIENKSFQNEVVPADKWNSLVDSVAGHTENSWRGKLETEKYF